MVDRGEVQRFVSRPDLIPPKITVVRRSPGTAPGLLFLGPSSGPGQRGAMIIDDAGELVWFRPTVPASVINLRATTYLGKPALTWWEGRTKHGLGIGDHVIADHAYREIARFPAGQRARLRPARADPHARGDGARHRLRHPDRRPLERRVRQGPRDRGGRAGARGTERPRALRVAEPRPRQAHGVLLEGRSRLRLLPRQLDRRRRRRQPARVGPQHLDGLQDRPHDRQGDVAARRQEERLRDGAGDASSPGSTTHAMSATAA